MFVVCPTKHIDDDMESLSCGAHRVCRVVFQQAVCTVKLPNPEVIYDLVIDMVSVNTTLTNAFYKT
jgi:hypothetical protein